MRDDEQQVGPAQTGALGGEQLLAATAGFIVLAATPPGQPEAPAMIAVPAAGRTGDPPPIRRPGRRPGPLPRVTFFGDSVSWTLGTSHLAGRTPTTWPERWRRGVTADPDVAVILLDRWELMDRRLDGEYRHVGRPDFDACLTQELELAIPIVTARGAEVALLTAPSTRRRERPDGGFCDEDLPECVDAYNRLLRRVAADRHASSVTVIDLNTRVCPQGRFTWSINGLRIRSDDLHFTPRAVRTWIAPRLLPPLAELATGAPSGPPGPGSRDRPR